MTPPISDSRHGRSLASDGTAAGAHPLSACSARRRSATLPRNRTQPCHRRRGNPGVPARVLYGARLGALHCPRLGAVHGPRLCARNGAWLGALHGARLLALFASALIALLAPAPTAQEPVATVRTADTNATRAESEFWAVDTLTPPDGALLEVGGMDWLPDGRLVLSTRRGQVWTVDNALADDPADARFSLYAEGLQEGLGLNVLDVPDGAGGTRSALFVLQRGELTELRDDDGDGRAETWLRVCDDWGLSGNYHEFAFGLPDDDAGNLYMSLNVGFLDPEWWLGRAVVPWRGWVLRVDPHSGEATPFACGFRSPCGLGFDTHGRLLLSDNQGDWLGSTPVFVVQEGGFHGHPASLDWTPAFRAHGLHASLEQPPEVPRVPPAVWVPYGWSRSAGNLVPLPADGAFGPYTDQLVMAELTNGHLMRLQLEEIGGVMQGAVLPLRQRIGSVVRVLFAEDGTLMAGLTNRGWGGLSPDSGVLRVRPTGAVPMELDRVHLVPGGFELTFSEALADGVAITPSLARVQQYDYDYWWEYGSPERHQTDVPVAAASLSPDRRTLSLSLPELRAAMVARVTLSGIVGASGRALLHEQFAYTVNQLADGSHTDALVSKAVPPPPPRTSGKEGWLRLTYGDALDAWESTGWALVNAEIDSDDRSTFRIEPGNNALVNVGSGPASDYVSRYPFGSGSYHVEFMLPEGGRSAVWVQGRYGIELTDDTFGLPEGSSGTGALLRAADGSFPGRHGTPDDEPQPAGAAADDAHTPAAAPTADDGHAPDEAHAGDDAQPAGAAPAPAADDPNAPTARPARTGPRPTAGLPASDAYTGAGQWHALEIDFEAPRFDEHGARIAEARFAQVRLDGAVLHDDLVLTGASGPSGTTEAPLGPLVIGGRTGPLALRTLEFHPTREPRDNAGWPSLIGGDDLSGWSFLPPTAAGDEAEDIDPDWLLEDGELIGEGERSWLLSPRGDYTDVSVRANVRINEGGDAGLLLRANVDGERVTGYEAQISSSFSDPCKTGGLYGLAPVKVELIPAGTWCDLDVDVHDEPGGTRITIAVNGVTTADFLDTERRFASGHIALQQHHDGGVLRLRELRVEAGPGSGR